MKKTEEEKLIETIEKSKWCHIINNKDKTVYIYDDTTSMRFANNSKELKKLKKLRYKIKLFNKIFK